MEQCYIPIALFILLIAWWIFGTAMQRWNGWRDTAHEMRADRNQWRRKADKATAMVDYFIGIAMDGSIHPHPHVCGQPGEGTYEECRECWLKAADEAVKEKPEC